MPGEHVVLADEFVERLGAKPLGQRGGRHLRLGAF